MIKNALDRLQYLCETIPQLLFDIDESEFSFKLSPNKWSKKEIIGHLIDSATNNHHRFIRGQFEDTPFITYDQNLWNEYNYYQQIDKEQIILFWTAYNKHLMELIKLIPEDNLTRQVNSEIGTNVSIEFLINNYIVHLEHHLRQVVDY